MKAFNYIGQLLTLVHEGDETKEVQVGNRIEDFRGKTHTVLSGDAPHKPGSTGYVNTNYGSFYVSVLNLKWVLQS
jgi:hypothetical protein